MIQLFKSLSDFWYIPQLNAFYTWLKKTAVGHTGGVYIHLSSLHTLTDQARRPQKTPASVGFVVCTSGRLEEALKEIDKNVKEEWVAIFASPSLEIWERQTLHTSSTLPLRLGLSPEEKKVLLKLARHTLTEHLGGSSTMIDATHEKYPDRFAELATLDVALWVAGELRGSIIMENKTLVSAIRETAIKAASDARFKPVVLDELSDTRIEICLMSSLRIPLLNSEYQKNEIYPSLGYTARHNNTRGWFVPAVFNCVTFATLSDLARHLARQKMGLLRTSVDLHVFSVHDWIEAPHSEPLLLTGPTRKEELIGPNDIARTLHAMTESAIDQLQTTQRGDGTLPPIISVLNGVETQIDWVRLSHTVYALSTYGTYFNHSKALSVAQKGYEYLISSLVTHPSIHIYTKMLGVVYLYHAASARNDAATCKQLLQYILHHIDLISYEPILYSQLSHVLLHAEKDECIERGVTLTRKVLADFKERRKAKTTIGYASYPELIPLLTFIAKITGDTDCLTEARQVRAWYVNAQRSDGAFPSTTNGGIPYTRGTGKIFEILSGDTEVDSSIIAHTVTWLKIMQYTSENTFFIRPHIAKGVLGGFRHDHLNASVWIDATSHILLGAVNWAQREA